MARQMHEEDVAGTGVGNTLGVSSRDPEGHCYSRSRDWGSGIGVRVAALAVVP